MIIRVELHSAITGQITEIERARIANVWHLVAKTLKAMGVWGMKRRSTENELIDIAAELRHETQAAYLLADGAREALVPKSQVEDNGDWTYTMPSWLAKDKGLCDE